MTNEEREKAIATYTKRFKCREKTVRECVGKECEECPLFYDDDELHEAEIIAIEALKQEPCEDTISRNEVYEQINCWIGSGEYKYTNATDYLTKRVANLSSVTPTQKMKAEIIDDLIKEIKDAEKKFDDKGAHHVSAGFYYARKELEKMKGV